MFELTIVFKTITPFISQNECPSGREIRGLFKEYAKILNAEHLTEDMIFKNSISIGKVKTGYFTVYNRGYKRYKGHLGTYRAKIYAKDRNAILPIIEMLKLNILGIGKGRTHGFGKIELKNHSLKKVDILFKKCNLVELSAGKFFLSEKRVPKPKVFSDALRSFIEWLKDEKCKMPTVYHDGKIFAKRLRKERIFKTVGCKTYTIDGFTYITTKPVTLKFAEPFTIPVTSGIWGVGEYITHGYGTLKINKAALV